MNLFGTAFRVSIFGESHGPGVGITLDGVPPGISLHTTDFEPDLARRRSGAKGTTPRTESDVPQFLSGLFQDTTTGAPLTLWFPNEQTQSKDYTQFIHTPRPGHADWVASQKFKGFQDYRGGGHFSGRLTVCLVAAGVVAKKIVSGMQISAKLIEAGGNTDIDAAIEKAVEMQDSIGGIIACSVTRIPVGLGEPFFHSVESLISQAVFSIPAVKGIEFGSGFAAARMTGAEHNDALISADGKTQTNYAGGINGGITNGNELIFRVAIKPPSSTPQPQETLNISTGKMETLEVKGRHDLCIALRAVVVVEAVTALVLADLFLQQQK